MWYFLPAHPVILNFYYFVNCFTFIFIFYYYYIILYYIFIFIFFIFLFIFFSFSSLLFSLSSFFSHLPTRTYPPSFPRHGDMPISPFFHHFHFFILFLFFLPTFQASHFAPPFFSPSFRVGNWTTSPGPPFSPFIDFFSLTTPNSDSQPCSPISPLHFFIFFFLLHNTYGRPTPISFPFYFLLQLVPTPTSPPDSIITVSGVTPAPFPTPFHPHFLHFSSFHFFIYLSSFLFIYYFYFIFVSQKLINPHCW